MFECLLNRKLFLVSFSERTVAAQVAVVIVEARIVEAKPLLQVQQFAGLLFAEVVDVADLLRE